MERLTMLIDSHLLDNGKLYREYDLNNKIQLNEYSCMDIPNAVYNKLGELEDVLEEFELTSAEDLRNFLNFKGNMAIWEGELNYKNKIADLEQQLHDLPKKIVEYFYDEIRHRAILEDDYCPYHNLERKYGVRKCLLENIRTTILKKYGGEDELGNTKTKL